MEPSFRFVYAWQCPFFFFAVGLRIDPTFSPPPGVGTTLLPAAVLGKRIGAEIPAKPQSGTVECALLGVSMIPQAEIALVIVQEGSELGERHMPKTQFGSMVIATVFTCPGTPVVF